MYPIYVVVIDKGELGQYYDAQGTDWADPPMLGTPGQTVQAGSRSYELFYAGEQVKTIAWREAGAVYWIENTLTNDLSPHTMPAVAEQTKPVVQGVGQTPASAGTASVDRIDLAPRAKGQTGLAWKLGALLGLAGLLVVAEEVSPRRRGPASTACSR